jgi:phenylalanyl-tRNA synthetase alpha chain
MQIKIDSPEEQALKAALITCHDSEGERIKRFLSMPDLSRTPGSPLKEVVERASAVKSLEGFDVIEIPEIVPVSILFDLFNMPEGHPARSKSDTYYVDDHNVLRTHDTVFWYYYLNHPRTKEKIAKREPLGAICYGKVYRKDEIDNRHMNVFHQFGAWYLVPDEKQTITPEDLKNALSDIATNVFKANFRFYDHEFPYTDPSFEMEAEINGKWIEMLGSGLVRKSVLKNMGLEGYNGWAFGFGLERLAIASMELPDIRLLWSSDERVKKQLVLGQKYKEVSKFPPVVRDISFVVPGSFVVNDYFDLIRDVAPDMVEHVELIDKYENAAYTYRITYRHLDKTLTNEEVNIIHGELENRTEKEFGAEIRRV